MENFDAAARLWEVLGRAGALTLPQPMSELLEAWECLSVTARWTLTALLAFVVWFLMQANLKPDGGLDGGGPCARGVTQFGVDGETNMRGWYGRQLTRESDCS